MSGLFMVLLDRTASNITGNRDEKGGMTGSKGPLVTFEPWAAVVSKQLLYMVCTLSYWGSPIFLFFI